MGRRAALATAGLLAYAVAAHGVPLPRVAHPAAGIVMLLVPAFVGADAEPFRAELPAAIPDVRDGAGGRACRGR